MFKAGNLNNLYARADRKCYLALQGKTPLLADSWSLTMPYGVWYVFTQGPVKRLYDDGTGIPGIGTVYRLNHDQATVPFELAKLDSVALDVDGGRVFCDLWTYATDPTPDADVLAVHHSFEVHQRVINGVAYDVQLGLAPPEPWITGLDPQSSWVRTQFAATNFPPYYVPARFHRYERAVAEIACEGLNLFVIKKEWTRYDCWRIHNLSEFSLTLVLEWPNGNASRQTIPPYECRTARRAENGLWMSVWPYGQGKLPTCYFWPYVKGDVPLFAGGPPQNYSSSVNSGAALALERSQSANNIANPWVILEWMQQLKATLNPSVPYDAQKNYRDFLSDPSNDDNLIGDCVMTWGRARLQDGAGNVEIIEIPNVSALTETLAGYGIDCTLSGTTLTITNRSQWTRIYPLDCNLFVTSVANRFWDISAASPSFGIAYPSSYCKQASADLLRWKEYDWSMATPPTIFDTIGTLRRKVLVEGGWMTSETEFEAIPEVFAASAVTLTPIGLMMRLPTTTPVYNVADQVDGTYCWEGGNFGAVSERGDQIHPRKIPYGASGDPVYELDNYWAADQFWLLAPPSNTGIVVFDAYRELFPCVNANSFATIYPSIWTAFVPPGGQWVYARTVYDWEVRRCFEITDDEDRFSFGADFWIGKWGQHGGDDSHVRVPGKPDVTPQFGAFNGEFYPETAPDDIWFDEYRPKRSGTSNIEVSNGTIGFDGQTTLLHEPQDGTSVHPYPFLNGSSPVQRIPKSAWLWDLLEWHVRSWRRSYRRVKGEYDCPVAEGRALFHIVDAAGSGEEFGQYVSYITEQGYNDLMANGVICGSNGINAATPYYVTKDNLADFVVRRGFDGYLLDSIQYPPSYPLGVMIDKRRLGIGETTEPLNLYSAALAWERSAIHRFVDLRFQGE